MAKKVISAKKVSARSTTKAAPKKTVSKKVAEKKVSAKDIEIPRELLKEKKAAKTAKPKASASSATRPKTKVAKVEEYSSLALAKTVAQGMFELKAENIRILDMRNIETASADFFVISHAKSDKQVEAIADSAEEEVLKIFKERPWHREGYENLEWVLLDYIDVVAHVFQEEKREFYGVEELWGDAVEVAFKGK